MEETVTQILVNVQNTSTIHLKCADELLDIFKKHEEEFSEQFNKYLKITLKANFRKRRVTYDRLIDFLSRFITVVAESGEIKINRKNEFIKSFETTILNLCSNSCPHLRYNSCIFISKLLSYDGYNKDDNFNVFVREMMIDLLQDTVANIRVKAIQILDLLQNGNVDDEIKNILIEYLSDENFKVRAAVIDTLPTNKSTFRHIIERCRDVNHFVRLKTFKKLMSIPAPKFSIEQRQNIVQIGLKGHDSAVVQFVSQEFLPKWFKEYDDIIALLKSLQLDCSDTEIKRTKEIFHLVLNILIKNTTASDLINPLKLENKLIPINLLTWENSLYWKELVLHLRKTDNEDLLDEILPETVFFCSHIRKFCKESKLKNSQFAWEQQEYFLILTELVCIAVTCDISDLASKNELESCLEYLLKEEKISRLIVDSIVEYFEITTPKVEDFIEKICNILSDIKEPLDTLEINEDDNKVHEYRKKLKLLNEQMDNLVIEQKYLEAKAIDDEITNLSRVLEHLQTKESSNDRTLPERNVKPLDIEIINKCSDIVLALFSSKKLTKMYPHLYALKDEIFREIVAVQDPIIEAKYFRCLGLAASFDKNVAIELLPLFCQTFKFLDRFDYFKIDSIIATLHSVVDIILIYGTNVLEEQKEKHKLNGGEDIDGSDTCSLEFDVVYGDNNSVNLNLIVDSLTKLLSNEHSEMRECASDCLVRLLVHKRIISPSLISQLLILVFNPVTDGRIRQTLSYFFETYCQIEGIDEQLEEAFIPTVRTISLAPENSPLSQVNKTTVFNALLNIIKLRYNNVNDYPLFENISIALCREMEKDVTNDACNVNYAKLLQQIPLSSKSTDPDVIEQIEHICNDVLQDTRNKSVARSLSTFITNLKKK